MKDEVKVAVVQMAAKQAVFNAADKNANIEKIVGHMKALGADNDLVIFPELATTGYIPFGYSAKAKIRLWEAADDPETDGMQALLKASEGSSGIFLVGFAERTRIKYDIYDSLAMLSNGKLLGIYRKIHLGGEEGHFFDPGPEPQVYKTKIGNIGMGICYDMVFPEQPRVLGVKGAEIMVFPAGWADLGNMKLMAKTLPVARAVENQTFVIFCNGVGMVGKPEFQLRFMGLSRIVSPLGDVLVESTTDQEEVIKATLKKSDLEKSTSIFFIFRDREMSTYAPLVQPYC